MPCLTHEGVKGRQRFLVSQYTDRDGQLVIHGMPLGRYVISVRHPTFAAAPMVVALGADSAVERSIVLLAGTPVDISATFGRFRVRDFCAAVCDTMGRVVATVNSYDFGVERQELPIALLTGVYRIVAVGPYLAMKSRRVEVGTRRLKVAFSLERAGWVELVGSIAQPDQCVLSDAKGNCLRPAGRCRRYIADPGGTVYTSLLIGHLPEGRYTLASGDESEPRKVAVKAGRIARVGL
jgi:hypothetical protein